MSSSNPSCPRNKKERAPDSLSQCKGCGCGIREGEIRYCVKSWSYYQHYYHPDCLQPQRKRKIPTLDQSTLVEERYELYERLHKLRQAFAAKLGVTHSCIFHDKTLVELVLQLPITEFQLLGIWGIKEKRAEAFGSAILDVIRQYQNPNNKKKSKPNNEDDDDDDDGFVEVEETLSAEEIVRRKFEEAKRSGNVISVDDGEEEEEEEEDQNPAATEVPFHNMKIKQLKSLCQQKGIDTTTMLQKEELVEALEEKKREEKKRELAAMPPSKLFGLCRQQGIETKGMLEKSELVQALLEKQTVAAGRSAFCVGRKE